MIDVNLYKGYTAGNAYFAYKLGVDMITQCTSEYSFIMLFHMIVKYLMWIMLLV